MLFFELQNLTFNPVEDARKGRNVLQDGDACEGTDGLFHGECVHHLDEGDESLVVVLKPFEMTLVQSASYMNETNVYFYLLPQTILQMTFSVGRSKKFFMSRIPS